MSTIPTADDYAVSLPAHISTTVSSEVMPISPIVTKDAMLKATRERVRVNAKLEPHDNAGNRWGGMKVRVVAE